MNRTLGDLENRLNLYQNDYYEDFRDVLTDNVMSDSSSFIQPGETQHFGNGCRLEIISHSPVDTKKIKNVVSDVIEEWGWELDSLTLIHSIMFLHMQAEKNVKIDIIWKVDETDDEDQPREYYPVGVFF